MDQTAGQIAGRTTARIGVPILLLAGLLAAIGSFLGWATLEAGGDTATASGIDGSDGYVTLVCGSVVAVVGLVSIRRPRRTMALLAIVAGMTSAGIGTYDALTAEDGAIDALAAQLADGFGVTEPRAHALLTEAVDRGLVGVSLQAGIFLVMGGGVLAIAGGTLLMAGGARPAASAGSGSAAAGPDPVDMSGLPPAPEPNLPATPPPPGTEGGPER
ncbi:MAG TPA: hypothetical protein VE669_03680 [Actinomycetota bacterium]|nr:hypothetical protein [Actinomycetota bacterium]